MTKWVLQILVSASVLFWSTQGEAQVTLDQFNPAPTQHDGFAVSRPDHPGILRPGAQLVLDYAKDPLVLEVKINGVELPNTKVVSDQLMGHALLSLGLSDRLLVFAHLPVSLLMNGRKLSDELEPDGAGLGNFGLGGRVRLLGHPGDHFALGAQATLGLPSSQWADSGSVYLGERSVTAHLQLLAEFRGARFRITPNVGTRLLSSDVSGLYVDNALTFGLGAAYGLMRGANELDIVAEVLGASTFSHFGDRESSPLEFLAGPKFRHASGFGAGLASGAGLSHGYGAPAYRMVGSLGWLKPTMPDGDGDRIPDPDDLCPEAREDRDHFEDKDGCPDLDNDGDSILDTLDKCPLEPEDSDDFEDDDGCPDGDDDHDGVADKLDHCPSDLEDRDGFNDEDGCPEPDNDGDSILDQADSCPLEAETVNGNEDEDGCPDKIRVDRAQGQIIVLEPVQFALNSARILHESFDMLDEIVTVLKAHPEIAQLSIEGHTDAVGSDQWNQVLSEKRAQSVRAYLIEGGVEEQRLSAKGFGESRPVTDNETERGRAKNRRVEFRM